MLLMRKPGKPVVSFVFDAVIILFVVLVYFASQEVESESGEVFWKLVAGYNGHARVLETGESGKGLSWEECREFERLHRQRLKAYRERIHLNWMDCKPVWVEQN